MWRRNAYCTQLGARRGRAFSRRLFFLPSVKLDCRHALTTQVRSFSAPPMRRLAPEQTKCIQLEEWLASSSSVLSVIVAALVCYPVAVHRSPPTVRPRFVTFCSRGLVAIRVPIFVHLPHPWHFCDYSFLRCSLSFASWGISTDHPLWSRQQLDPDLVYYSRGWSWKPI